MAEQKQRKHWQEMPFRGLDNKALIEHSIKPQKEKGSGSPDLSATVGR